MIEVLEEDGEIVLQEVVEESFEAVEEEDGAVEVEADDEWEGVEVELEVVPDDVMVVVHKNVEAVGWPQMPLKAVVIFEEEVEDMLQLVVEGEVDLLMAVMKPRMTLTWLILTLIQMKRNPSYPLIPTSC